MSQQQQLSHKDAALFRQVVRNFENKQYKKGVKAAEQILKKNPNHADTQAMKALIISHQGQQKEAFALAKLALNNNMRSHVCWHVYGLLYRADKNFDESIKAYKFALKLDPESVPIQRDLAHLQIQMRDYEGYVQSRKNMLQQKPGFRQNWTALALAHHLAGNLGEAENVLTTFEDTLKQKPVRADLEHWEAVLYKTFIIGESGDLAKAVAHLDAIGKKSPDILAVMEMKAEFLLKLGKKEEATVAYEALLDRYPDNSSYYDQLMSAKGLEDGPESAQKELFDSWAVKFPRADTPRRRPLNFLTGDAFKEAAEHYLRPMLRKGVPSTFANIKTLYKDRSKMEIVHELATKFVGESDPPQMNGSAESESKKGSSQFKISALYFLAQHYNHWPCRDLDKALQHINEALKLDSSSIDLYQTKARTLKYLGAVSEAKELMEKARSLDERDRAINTKCAKYQLRDDANDKALDTMSKFTRNEAVGGPLGDLIDMQCVWYLTEDGESYLRQQKLGLALKRLHTVFNIFDIWQEDQFDFHSFSLRKGMIRAYIGMLRWEDRLREHPSFSRAAISAVKAYILLHDYPVLAHGPLLSGTEGLKEGQLDDITEKKARKKAKKEQLRLEKVEAERREAFKSSKAGSKASDGDSKKEDADPFGKTLVETKEPLQDAMKFLTPLLELMLDNSEAQLLGFEVYYRRRKYLPALKCLLHSHHHDDQGPALHVQAYRFHELVKQQSNDLPVKFSDLLSSESKALYAPHSDMPSWNDAFLERHQGSAAHIQAGHRVRGLLSPETKEQSQKELIETLSFDSTNLQDATSGSELLRDWDSPSEIREKYGGIAAKRWPKAKVFQGRPAES